MTTAGNQFSKNFFGLCALGAMMTLASAASPQEPATAPSRAERTSVPERVAQFYAEFDEETLRKAPKRDVKVQTTPPQAVRIRRIDAKTLENKFVASMVLVRALPESNEATNRSPIGPGTYQDQAAVVHSFPEVLARLLFPGGRPAFHPEYGGGNPFPILESNSDYCKVLIENCPEGERPADGVISFLKSDAANRDMTRRYDGRGGMQWSLSVYAPTEDEARKRLEALLPLFDHGLCLPLQRHCLAEGRKALEAAKRGYEELPKYDEAVRIEGEKLAKPSEITPDILTQLKAQKVMVAVEVAGLNARVKACNEMLKEVRDDTRPPSPLENSIGDMKVRAEVELIGIKEKLDQINAFVAEGNEREDARTRMAQLSGARAAQRNRIRQDERLAERYARLVLLYAPFQLKDNQITVAPIEWTN